MRRIPAILAFILWPVVASAGEVGDKELTAQVGWQFGGTQDYYGTSPSQPGGSLHANAAINYGGTVSVFIRPGYAAELSYSYQATDLMLQPFGGFQEKLADMSTHYILLSGLREIGRPDSRAMPFVLGSIGAAGFVTEYQSEWRLAFGVGGGVKAALSPKVGLRLQARALFPVDWFSSGVYFGGGSTTVAVSSVSALVQGDVSGGLVFRLGS